MDDGIILLIIGAVVIIVFSAAIVADGGLQSPIIPIGCGISDNASESYTTTAVIFTGKILVPIVETHRYNDLICSNGTVILKWENT